MILIVTHKNDLTADIVIRKLNEKKINYFRFNTEDYLIKNDVSLVLNNSSQYYLINNISNFKSIWFRRIKTPNFESDYIHSEIKHLFNNLWEMIEGKWLSIPKYIYIAENKLFQLVIAKKIGFNIPNTLVTSNRSELKNFFFENKQNIIIKPLKQGRVINKDKVGLIYTNILDVNKISKLDEYILTPCIIQENLGKQLEIRVTVVENKVFAAYIDSQIDIETKVDWRRGKKKFKVFNLDFDIEQKCIQLVKKLNLSFGAIDLILTPENDYYFLEINPNGQWGWIEYDTGLKISDSIIDYLS